MEEKHMLNINLIRTSPEEVQKALLKKGFSVNFDEFLSKDKERRTKLQEVENLKAKRNKVSSEVPKLKKEGKPVEGVFEEMRLIGAEIARLDAEVSALDSSMNDFLAGLPNIPDPDLLPGEKENNKVIKEFKEKPVFSFQPKNHVELCTSLKMIDYERGTKIAGGGYWLYRGMGARLEWALLNYFIDTHLKDGYEFILPPHMLNYDCGFGAGQFPKFAEDVYWLEGEADRKKNRFMLPTAETALVNLYAGEIMDEADLPKKLFAYTPCYRKEAGSYGSEERGMIRGHQFNKVEMVQYAHPEKSAEAFEELVNKAAALVEGLGLHFHISKLAAGDCSASMARTYDIEVWIPSMGIYKEVSSVSNANDYQARRNNTKYRDSLTGKTNFVHTLNGSGLATSRVIPAIVEQFQNADGSITVPEALRKYLGTDVLNFSSLKC
jgi:seryl-tRNA synthetase